MIVGFNATSYAHRRNIIGAVPTAEYKRIYDPYSIIYAIMFRVSRVAGGRLRYFDSANQFRELRTGSTTITHLFNGVSYGGGAWVSTFETCLPRFKCMRSWQRADFYSHPRRKVAVALRAIASQSCKAILAMSRAAANIQRRFLDVYPETRDAIHSKLSVLHPPQAIQVQTMDEKPVSYNGPIRFMFVGSSFHRKGGLEIIETLASMRQRYQYPIELTIVSSLELDNYATNEKPKDIIRALDFINQNRDWIQYQRSLPNGQVADLMREHHVGLLPTYADTYGYSVLEFQAAGCPVVTTNVRALPEINDDRCGWVIPIVKDDLGEALYGNPAARGEISKSIRGGIESAVHEIFDRRANVLVAKGGASIERIRLGHDPAEYGKKLLQIYSAM